jgi:hypothetical protein
VEQNKDKKRVLSKKLQCLGSINLATTQEVPNEPKLLHFAPLVSK